VQLGPSDRRMCQAKLLESTGGRGSEYLLAERDGVYIGAAGMSCREDVAGGREWDGAPAVYLQWVTHV
jgi:hypothetical protein